MMRSTALVLIFTGLMVAGYIHMASAQSPHADPVSTMSTPGVPGTGMLNPADVAKLNGLDDRKSVKAKARAKTQGAKLVQAINLPCDLIDAEQVGGGSVKQDGKTIDLTLYEISCSNGMGYFLESRGPQRPLAISCFAANAMHTADIAQNAKSDFYCQLPANKDIKAMAASLMTVAGTTCTVKNLRWFGLTDSGQTEYSEVACDDNKGYFLKTSRNGPAAQTTVMSCQEAAKSGLRCRLTNDASVSAPVSKQVFLDALKQSGVSCEPSQMRVIGRESVDKRYVVEFQCSQPPIGLVAFVPLEGNTNKFETLDCAAAVERGVVCQLATK
jgi:hypothetical protein